MKSNNRTSNALKFVGSALAVAALSPQSSNAGGLGLYEIATPDVGLASAGYAARADDASTVFKNPAGMSRLEGAQLQSGLQLLYADLTFSPDGGTTTSGGDGGNAIGAMPGAGLFVTIPVSEKLTLGFGSCSYFGLAVSYDNDWAGRYYVRDGTLIGMSLLPSASYKVNDWLSVGAGLNAMYGMFETKVAVNNLEPGRGDGGLKLEDEEWGFGGNFGILITPDERTRIGVTYLSPVCLDFSDTPSYNNLGPGLGAVLTGNNNLDLGMTVPQQVMVSFYRDLNEKWAIMADVGWQDWSAFGKVDVSVDSASSTDITTDLNYDDTWHGAIGAAYKATDKWTLLGGFAYDTSAVDDDNRTFSVPMGEAYRFGIGALFHKSEKFDFGAGFEFIWAGDMEVDQSGALRGDVSGEYKDVYFTFFSLNMTWRF